jgi:hypothetical protein
MTFGRMTLNTMKLSIMTFGILKLSLMNIQHDSQYTILLPVKDEGILLSVVRMKVVALTVVSSYHVPLY